MVVLIVRAGSFLLFFPSCVQGGFPRVPTTILLSGAHGLIEDGFMSKWEHEPQGGVPRKSLGHPPPALISAAIAGLQVYLFQYNKNEPKKTPDRTMSFKFIELKIYADVA